MMKKFRHSDEAKRKIGASSKARNSASVALKAKLAKSKKDCSVTGCKRKHAGLGFCEMHYQRFKKRGDPGSAESLIKGVYINAYGYKFTNSKADHIAVAEKALGKKLPSRAVVHHINENKLDNDPKNLVICPDKAYHNLIHARMRAMDECGNPNWMKCPFCKKYDSPENLYVYPNKRAGKHRECYRRYKTMRAA